MVSATIETTKAKTRTFYVWMGIASAAIALIGFSQRYFLAMANGTLHVAPIVHFHGIVTFGWVAFLILQTSLVASGRTALHRSLGMAGIALGTLLVFTAAEIAILQAARDSAPGGWPLARNFLILPLSNAVMIAGLFGFAIANVRDPETHKRLMMLGTFVILNPAFARIFQMFSDTVPPDRILYGTLGAAATDVMILIAIAFDVKTRGKPHPAYLIGGGCILAVQALRAAIAPTPAWHDAADWLIGLAH